jgi:uncharacterized protein involved in exopolysaccharide biosynthesis
MASESNLDKSHDSSLDSSNLLVFFYRWKWVIIIICFVAAILSSIASLLIEEKYQSSVIMFATEQHSIGEQFLEDIKRKDLLEYGEKDDAERLLQILNSDQIRNTIIEEYDLWEDYDVDSTEAGAHSVIHKEYNSNVTAKLTRFGSIQIDVLDKDPVQARNMCDKIAALADTVSNQLRSDRARKALEYCRISYEDLQAEIQELEDSMAALHRLGVYDYLTQIEGLNEQYATALGKGQVQRAQDVHVQMEKVSEYGSIFNKLQALINAAYNREAVLKKRFDLMYIDVNSNLPSKFVVDSAAVSDKKAYPIRWLIVVMSVASAFVFIVMFLLIWDNLKRLRIAGKI